MTLKVSDFHFISGLNMFAVFSLDKNMTSVPKFMCHHPYWSFQADC